MQTRNPYRGMRFPALSGGVVAVAALALVAFSAPVSASGAAELREQSSGPSISGSSPAAPEQALHRVYSGTAGTAVRLAPRGGCCLPVPVQPPPATRCGGPSRDSFGFASPTSGPPLRILFCTWLN